ncbi:MAG: inactive transglutaminase family protein [Pseudomonadota bacterium]
MSKRNSSVVIAAIILTLSAAIMVYFKVTELGLPLSPEQRAEGWTVEARVAFTARDQAAKIDFYIPKDPPNFTVLDEDFVSSNYGLAVDTEGANRIARWAIRRVNGEQVLYYRIELIAQPGSHLPSIREPAPPAPLIPEFNDVERSAIEGLIQQAQGESADTESFARAILRRLIKSDESSVELLKQNSEDPVEWTRYVQKILAGARIPTRLSYMLPLKDGARNLSLIPWLEVYTGEFWQPFNPVTGEPGWQANAVLWRVGDDPLVRVFGADPAEVDFSSVQQSRAMVSVAEQRALQVDSKLMQFSMFSLPVQTQNVYRILLMLPLGALVVVVMRNIIGLTTFGVFMPILIAMSFRETHLAAGIILYIVLLSLGLSVRFALERLKLLMVPRLAAMLIVVLITMVLVSILSHKLNIQQGLSIALFPLVIVAMTIEKMSVVWEERGPRQAILQCIGSLLTASIGFAVMNIPILQYWLFVFPELSFVVLASVLLLGRYTGYRLSELWRFRHLLWPTDAVNKNH